MAHRQTQTYWRTVVEDVEYVLIERQSIDEALDYVGKAVEL
jgi:hypothetical protein